MTILGATARFFALPSASALLAIQIFTCAVAAWRCRRRKLRVTQLADLPPISLVRPLCGLEPHIEKTINASFAVDYPDFELLFCIADPEDPVAPLVRRAIEAHPHISARLLIGDDPISRNPKLNNMVKAWKAATHDRIVFADSNLLVPSDYLRRLGEAWEEGERIGLVSAPPIGGASGDFWGDLECAFLNSYEARWQYFVDAFGYGFAQGKTLYYRRSLVQGGVEALGSQPAEDAATTKIIRAAGLRVRLARPPFVQPLGPRRLREVWSRQLRWARLRRATFPLLFVPEVLTGGVFPLLCVTIAALGLSWPLAPVLALYFAAWYGAEIGLCLVCGWQASARDLLAFIVRDALIPALWIEAQRRADVVWKGRTVQGAGERQRAEQSVTKVIRWDFRRPSRGFAPSPDRFRMSLTADRARARVGAAVRRIRRSR